MGSLAVTRLLAIGAALLLLPAAPAAAVACPADAARELPALASSTLAAVETAARLVAAGRPPEADAALAEVERRTPVLQASLDCLAARIAPVERQCAFAVSQLEGRMSDLRTRERELDDSLGRLREALAEARAGQSLNQAELARKRAEADAAARQLAELRERQRELESWWWVPGYGQYLAIRTLADNDIGRHRTAVDELNAAQRTAADLKATLHRHAVAALNASNAAQCTVRVQRSLEAARHHAFDDLGRARAARVFLARAGTFLSHARTLATSSGARQAEVARMLIGFIESEGPDAALGLDGQVGSMAAGLRAFAQMIAERPDYLSADAVSCDFDTATPEGEALSGGAREGLLLKTADAPTIWLIDGDRRRALPDMRTLHALGLGDAGYLLVSPERLAGFVEGPPIPTVAAPPGAVVRNAAGTHYLLQDGWLRSIPNPETFEGLDLRWDETVLVDDATLAALPAGAPFPALPPRPAPPPSPFDHIPPALRQALAANGATPAVGVEAPAAGAARLVRNPSDGGTYMLRRGRRLHIPDPETFDALGLRWDEVVDLSSADIASIPDSCPTRLAP